jgi:hypothetical protein
MKQKFGYLMEVTTSGYKNIESRPIKNLEVKQEAYGLPN